MTLSFTLEFLRPYVPTANFYILMYISGGVIERVEAAFAAVKKRLFMVVKLSVFGFHWVSVIVLPRLPREQSLQDFGTRYKKILLYFIIIKKYIDRLETKMTDVDPSIVVQHVRPLKNNYFEAWTCWCERIKFWSIFPAV